MKLSPNRRRIGAGAGSGRRQRASPHRIGSAGWGESAALMALMRLVMGAVWAYWLGLGRTQRGLVGVVALEVLIERAWVKLVALAGVGIAPSKGGV